MNEPSTDFLQINDAAAILALSLDRADGGIVDTSIFQNSGVSDSNAGFAVFVGENLCYVE